MLVFHTVVLVQWSYWSQPIGWLLALLVAAGTVSAVLVLTHRVGGRRTVQGRIVSLQPYPALRVLETRIRLDGLWPGHRAGQFAFVTSDPKEGAHPYTIASAWMPQDPCVTFITKALGDHTSRLPDRLRVGDHVTVEGPYGCFTFDDARPRQIWIGAGIGITPFIARMKQLAHGGSHSARPIDLFHTTADHDPVALDKLRVDAQAAGVRLHLFVDAQDGRLDGERLRALVPEWRNASVWFCGPIPFASALRADLAAHGLPTQAFHQELFQMR